MPKAERKPIHKILSPAEAGVGQTSLPDTPERDREEDEA
jgi:hypothetical protein